MKNIYLHLSLITTFILLFFVSNIFLAQSLNYWYYTPNIYVNVGILVVTVALLIIGFNKRTSSEQLFYGIAISVLLISTACVMSISAFFSPIETQDFVQSYHSPNEEHTLEVYFMEKEYGSFDKVMVYEKGPLWFKRLIYHEDDQSGVVISWNSNTEVEINKETLDLTTSDTILLLKTE